jgi:predicted MPP superfamily phosphohydrolase
LSTGVYAIAVAAAVVLAAAILIARRSLRSGLVLLALYTPQAACTVWAARAIDGASWSGAVRAAMACAIVAVLLHRIATYALPRPPAGRDRVLVPLVHIAQAWLFIQLVAWPIRTLTAGPSSSLDAWVLGMPVAISAVFLAWTHKRPRTTRLRVSVPALSRPLRVVHISDLHVGPYVPETRLIWLAEALAQAAPDVIAITGDFLTQRTLEDWSEVVRFVERLRARDGVFACLGNHDAPVAAALTASLRASGVTVLRDGVAWLPSRDGCPPIAIGGVDWRAWREGRQAYARAFADITASDPALVLCHDPSVFRLAPPAFRGLMLAGHLHGGQLGFTWGSRGASILRLFGMYDQGLFVRANAVLYSHRGTGVYGFPLRIGVPSEIAVIDLVPADQPESSPAERAW